MNLYTYTNLEKRLVFVHDADDMKVGYDGKKKEAKPHRQRVIKLRHIKNFLYVFRNILCRLQNATLSFLHSVLCDFYGERKKRIGIATSCCKT